MFHLINLTDIKSIVPPLKYKKCFQNIRIPLHAFHSGISVISAAMETDR